jgi:hypothetical protein
VLPTHGGGRKHHVVATGQQAMPEVGVFTAEGATTCEVLVEAAESFEHLTTYGQLTRQEVRDRQRVPAVSRSRRCSAQSSAPSVSRLGGDWGSIGDVTHDRIGAGPIPLLVRLKEVRSGPHVVVQKEDYVADGCSCASVPGGGGPIVRLFEDSQGKGHVERSQRALLCHLPSRPPQRPR